MHTMCYISYHKKHIIPARRAVKRVNVNASYFQIDGFDYAGQTTELLSL